MPGMVRTWKAAQRKAGASLATDAKPLRGDHAQAKS